MIFSQKESIYMRLAIAAPQMVSFCVQISGCEILCIIFLAPTDIFSVSLKRRTNNRTALFPKCYIHNVSYIYTLLFSSKIYNFLLHHRTVYNATKMWAVGIKQTRMHRFGGGGGAKLSAICYTLPRVTHPQRPRERKVQQRFPLDGFGGFGSTFNRQAIEPHSALLPSRQTWASDRKRPRIFLSPGYLSIGLRGCM